MKSTGCTATALIVLTLVTEACQSGAPGSDAASDDVPDASDGNEDFVDVTLDPLDDEDASDVYVEDSLEPSGNVLLGQGGFFGVSGKVVGGVTGASLGSFAIGAHYADISDGTGAPHPAGRVYVFDNGAFPGTVEEASLVLQPPDGSEGGGFGWAISGPCDFDGDGNMDLAIGNHLHSELPTTNCGRVVVFWGGESGIDPGEYTYHMLGTDIRASSDVLGQTVLCADLDGDDFDDLVASGQNAGPDDTGMVAIFHGSATGLPSLHDASLYPTLVANQQYFGSASLWADLDGDGFDDLAIGGWGLVKGDTVPGPHTGGVLVFAGGDDWSAGPSYGVFPVPDGQFQVGSSVIAFTTPGGTFLAVGAPDWGLPATGAVLVWAAGFEGFEEQPPLQVLVPPGSSIDTGFGGSLAFAPDYLGENRGALLVGMKYGDASGTLTSTGAVAVFATTPDGDGFEETPTLLTAPTPMTGDAFGGAIVPLDDVDQDASLDFFVGMESHVEGDIYTGVQTGGVVFF